MKNFLTDCRSDLSAAMGPGDVSKVTHDDRVKMIHLRRYLDQLSDKVLQKDYVVQKTRLASSH